MFPTNDPQQMARAVNGLLEADYVATAGRVIETIAQNSTGGLLSRRIKEVQAEAIRLEAAGEKFDSNNPILRALLADTQDALNANVRAINAAGSPIQQSAVELGGRVTQQLALPGEFAALFAEIGVEWNVPDANAINAAIGFIDDPAWSQEVGDYAPLVFGAIENVLITGLVQGWGSRRLARELAERVETLPVSQADNLMRTLQGQAFREAQLIHRMANADILNGQIRIAALDVRTCLACIALHGTELPINERIDDHHRGRCTSIPMETGRPRNVTTGEEWFDSQPAARQLEIAGHANFEALNAGAVRLSDFVQPYQSQVFGDMLRQASLVSILGPGEAKGFYLHG